MSFPSDDIDEIESVLTNALSLRRSRREELKKKKRREVRDRNHAEEMLDGASGDQATELQRRIDAKEQHISEYRDRIEGLTQQITVIQRWLQELEVIRMNPPDLGVPPPILWQETTDGATMDALLDEIDQMLEECGVDVGTSTPQFSLEDLVEDIKNITDEADGADEPQNADE